MVLIWNYLQGLAHKAIDCRDTFWQNVWKTFHIDSKFLTSHLTSHLTIAAASDGTMCHSFTSHYCTFIQHTWPRDRAHTRLSSLSHGKTKLSIASGPRRSDKYVSFGQLDRVSLLVSPRTGKSVSPASLRARDINWMSLHWFIFDWDL